MSLLEVVSGMFKNAEVKQLKFLLASVLENTITHKILGKIWEKKKKVNLTWFSVYLKKTCYKFQCLAFLLAVNVIVSLQEL